MRKRRRESSSLTVECSSHRTRRPFPAGAQGVECFDWFGAHDPGPVFDSCWNNRDVSSRQHRFLAGDREGDRAADDHGNLFLGMGMDRKDRPWRVGIADHRLVGAVDRLAGNARIDLFSEQVFPRRTSDMSIRAICIQNKNQPAKSASDSRKKKTLATPPPVTR